MKLLPWLAFFVFLATLAVVTLIYVSIGYGVSWINRREAKVIRGYRPKNHLRQVGKQLKECPWPEDLFIECASYASADGTQHNYVVCEASGPNLFGKTFHSAFIGYWNDFGGREEAYEFGLNLRSYIKDLINIDAPIYYSRNSINEYAKWCLGERNEKPKGEQP